MRQTQPPTTKENTMNATNLKRLENARRKAIAHAATTRTNGAVDQEVFESAFRENMSPDGVATLIAFLQPALSQRAPNERAASALREVEWLHDTLIDMLGVDEVDRLMEELSL